MTLYRLYRPQQFASLLGQSFVAETLQLALLKDKVAHAYLFTGPRGSGKTTAARLFARAICCLSPIRTGTTFEPCNTCAACSSLLENSTPDFTEIDAASNRGIEDIRQLREDILFPPITLKKKIYLIDEVHMLTVEAFNALLKIIEEPPSHALFILATTELQKVPLTIRSRCQVLNFEKGSPEAVTVKLKSIIKKENWQVEPAVIALIAHHTDGSFRDAETLLELLTTKHQPLVLAQAEQILGTATKDFVNGLVTALLEQDKVSTIDVLKKIPEMQTRNLTQQILREIENRFYNESPESLSTEKLGIYCTAISQLLEAFLLQKHSPSAMTPLTIACLTIVNLEQDSSRQGSIQASAELMQSPSLVKHSPTSLPANTSTIIISPRKNVVSESVPVIELHGGDHHESLADIRKAWSRMIERIAQTNLILAQVLQETVFHTAEENVITIHVRFQFHVSKLAEPKNIRQVINLLQELTDSVWKVHYVINQSLPRRAISKRLTSSVEEAHSVFNNQTTPQPS